MARETEFILPSGVKMAVRSLRGGDQGTITNQENKGNIKAFNKMLSDCTLSLGDKKTVTPNDIENMLTQDRKYALVHLRQFSLKHKEEFEFSFEWPITEGAKDVQEYTVNFDEVSFPTTPYLWVREKMESMTENEKEDLKTVFPKMYDSYKEMLEANLERTFEFEGGEQIEWCLVTGKVEKDWSGVSKKLMDSNMQLNMRNPKVHQKKKDGGTALYKWSPIEADILDTEAFRKELKNVEGEVDTFLTIQHQKDETRSTRVDLVATVDFFFPSQAI